VGRVGQDALPLDALPLGLCICGGSVGLAAGAEVLSVGQDALPLDALPLGLCICGASVGLAAGAEVLSVGATGAQALHVKGHTFEIRGFLQPYAGLKAVAAGIPVAQSLMRTDTFCGTPACNAAACNC
jgi:hypothetical protein